MNIIFACLYQLFLIINTIQHDDELLLNGLEFPSSIYIPLDKSYLLECYSKNIVYWKIYLNNGNIETIRNKSIYLKEFDKNRDGFYQCHTLLKSKNIFIFSNSARSIDRQWTELKEFHENLLTICRPIYFNYGFNEQFIELIDSKQTVRYNRSALLVKHIRSTTHLFCKLFIDTTCVGIRVQTLIKQNLDNKLLSDQLLKTNDYLEMKTNERDIYRIAFEDDSVYFHCPSKTNSSVQWKFLSFNYYLMKTLPIIYNKDTKINSVKITDAGMYTCQTDNIIHKRIILTIIHPPKSPDNKYEHTIQVNLNSKYLICCHLDAIPYPTYSWSMINEIWCLKRCCWLHIIHKNYQNIICTSANQLGKAKYNIYLIVNDTDSNGTVVYDEPKIHNHNQTNDFHLIRKIRENPGITPMIISTDVKTYSSKSTNEISKTDKAETIMNIWARKFPEHEIDNDRTISNVNKKTRI